MNRKRILEKLKTEGYRLTIVRKMILELLEGIKKPLSSPELKIAMEKMGVFVNKTTIYREISFLKEQKLILEVQLNDRAKRYEIFSGDHHHHGVCLSCSKVEEIRLEKDLDEQEKKIEKNINFKIISHSLEFYGFCKKCK